jgi:succinoglycan biosynthesis protein ExoM
MKVRDVEAGFRRTPVVIELPTSSIIIAVLTYKRPQDLRRILPLLIREALSVRPIASVLVIDNDPSGSAREVVGLSSREVQVPDVVYIHEPTPGIGAARSRALQEAAGAEYLAFIDDDEEPIEGWLGWLVDLQQSTGASAVVGPVISEFAHEPSSWIQEGRFFDRRRLPTGSPLDVAATNNLLLHMPTIRRLELDFDRAFGLLGGEDTLFTRQLITRGGSMIWCDEAIVVDHVPSHRLTRRWVLSRAFSSGNSWSRVSLKLEPQGRRRLGTRMHLIVQACTRVAGGTARFAWGVSRTDLSSRVRGLRTVARGIGMFTGAIDFAYVEYKRGTSSPE